MQINNCHNLKALSISVNQNYENKTRLSEGGDKLFTTVVNLKGLKNFMKIRIFNSDTSKKQSHFSKKLLIFYSLESVNWCLKILKMIIHADTCSSSNFAE